MVLMNWKAIQERYKNDPEYLEILRLQRNADQRRRYHQRKEKENKNGNNDISRRTDIPLT